MSIRMMSGLSNRIVQVLQEFMPTELGLIDTEEADGITTPTIPDANYHQWDRNIFESFPAFSIQHLRTTPLELHEAPMEQSIWAAHQVALRFHATLNQALDADPAGNSPLVLQKLMHRYVNAAMRVIAIRKTGLETTADPVRFVENVWWNESALYGPEADQGDGTKVRTATLPLEIRRREIR